MTAKQCVVLGALRDAQHEHDGQAVGAYRIAAVCPVPWQGRPDLVAQALVLLQRDGLVLVAGGSTRAWKITAAGRLMLAHDAARHASGRSSAADRTHCSGGPPGCRSAVELLLGVPLTKLSGGAM